MAEPIAKPRFRVADRAMEVRKGPTIRDLRSRAIHAMRESEGIDFGPLSREERDALLLKQFGI